MQSTGASGQSSAAARALFCSSLCGSRLSAAGYYKEPYWNKHVAWENQLFAAWRKSLQKLTYVFYTYIYICIYTHIIIETCLFIYIYPDSYSQARGAALPCPQRWPCRPVQSSSRQRMPMRSGCAKLLNTSARADIFSRSSRTWRSPSSSAQHSKRVSAVCPGAWSPTSLQAGWPRTKAMEIHLRYAGEPLCQEGEAGA